MDENGRIFQHLPALGIGHEVRREVASVERHTTQEMAASNLSAFHGRRVRYRELHVLSQLSLDERWQAVDGFRK